MSHTRHAGVDGPSRQACLSGEASSLQASRGSSWPWIGPAPGRGNACPSRRWALAEARPKDITRAGAAPVLLTWRSRARRGLRPPGHEGCPPETTKASGVRPTAAMGWPGCAAGSVAEEWQRPAPERIAGPSALRSSSRPLGRAYSPITRSLSTYDAGSARMRARVRRGVGHTRQSPEPAYATLFHRLRLCRVLPICSEPGGCSMETEGR